MAIDVVMLVVKSSFNCLNEKYKVGQCASFCFSCSGPAKSVDNQVYVLQSLILSVEINIMISFC